MRRVDSGGEIAAAFASAQREAEGAFGDGSIFVEKLIERPRHIEVQVLADQAGEVVHLFERDCSVQLRNQKLVEIAPAPNLDDELRQRILDDALRLAKAGGLVNAATIEFLVAPNLGVHFFIECNPRIQVEHTVTEEVTGIDLVEAQFRIAGGERLAELGIVRQTDIAAPRRFAVQARVLATGAGTITAYREPAGRGVRVDSCGYLGLAPPPQFDPMFAKVIGVSNSTGSLESALERTSRALADFQIGGLPTNLAALRAILDAPEVRAGDARTSLLADHPALMAAAEAAPTPASPRSLLDAQAAALGGSSRRIPSSLQSLQAAASLEVRDGEAGVECPMAGSVVELTAAPGTEVAAGDVLMVVSAMKMETAVTAPCAGVVAELAPVEVGGAVAAGQIVATITPSQGAGPSPHPRRGHLGAAAGRGGDPAGHRPRPLRAGLDRSGRGAPAQPRQAHLPRAHRPAARSGHLPRDRQRRRLRELRRRGPHRRVHALEPRRRLGPDRRPHRGGLRRRLHLARRPRRRLDRRQERPPRPPLAGVPVPLDPPAGRLVRRRQRRGDGAASAGRRRKRRQGKLGRHHCRTAARLGRRRLVPAGAPGLVNVRRAAGDPCRWSTCSWAASSASARPRRCSATSR